MLIYHRNQLQIIQYDQLLQVDTNQVVVQRHKQKLIIKGKELFLTLMNENEIMIQGELYVIEIQ